jgi:tetratricopeptide (TPR) repeat protein
MPRWKLTQGRFVSPPLGLLVSAVWWSASSLTAQDLPLKRVVPASGPYECAPVAAVLPPAPEERQQARQLASLAAQAVILGNLERARALLDRATGLDPASADLAYQRARVLEELGDRVDAISEYCRVLSVDSKAEGAGDARDRIQALAAADRAVIPDSAVAAFETGLAQADAGFLDAAAAAFTAAAARAPGWPDAVYDRGVILARMGRAPEATRDLRRYLALRPDAADAITVSQRIGELQTMALVDTPSPGVALALGVLMPGMGQFYSGRALGGVAVLALAGGSVAAGFLIKQVQVKCLAEPGPDGTCPEGQVLSQDVRRPYRIAGLGAAAAIGVIGAAEAFVRLRGRRNATEGIASIDLGGARVGALGVAPAGGRVDLRLVRLTF